jgi:hypothetical protein
MIMLWEDISITLVLADYLRLAYKMMLESEMLLSRVSHAEPPLVTDPTTN